MTLSRSLSVALCVCALVCCVIAVPVKISPQSGAGPERSYGDSWTDCGKGSTELRLKNVTVTPEPVKAGQDFTLVFDVENVETTIQSATFKTQVYLIGVPVYSETDNLCDLNSCPMTKGRSTVTITTMLPSMAPPGWYSLHIDGLDQDEAPVLCADITFTIYPW